MYNETIKHNNVKLKLKSSIKSYHQFDPLCLQKCEYGPSQVDFYQHRPRFK